MKKFIESAGIFIIALTISTVIYPFLHELGHLIMIALLRIRIVEINLFPTPNIMYQNTNINNIGNLLIGFGGVFLPTIISISIKIKKFWGWYANFILKSICLLSMIISGLSIIFENNKMFVQDDMITLLNLWKEGKLVCLVMIICITIILIFNIYKQDLNRIYEFK